MFWPRLRTVLNPVEGGVETHCSFLSLSIIHTTSPSGASAQWLFPKAMKKGAAIFYFFQVRDQVVLVHAFSKKTQQLKNTDIDLAEKRMADWLQRFPAGGER
jgi:hypothetical protein